MAQPLTMCLYETGEAPMKDYGNSRSSRAAERRAASGICGVGEIGWTCQHPVEVGGTFTGSLSITSEYAVIVDLTVD